jgi:hypothetical protein
VIVAVPAATPVITPLDALTDAIPVLEELYVPPLVVDVNVVVEPMHTVCVPVNAATVGRALTVADVVAALLVHPSTVTVTLYVPVAAVVALAIEGFCKEDVKLFGPVHAYVALATVLAVKFNVAPAHIAPLLPAVGALGAILTVTVVPALAALEHPLTVDMTVYTPLAVALYVVDVAPLIALPSLYH